MVKPTLFLCNFTLQECDNYDLCGKPIKPGLDVRHKYSNMVVLTHTLK